MLKYYLKGVEEGDNNVSEKSNLTSKQLAKQLDLIILPRVSELTDPKDLDDIIDDVYIALPNTKATIDDIRSTDGGNTGSGILALPILPIVYGLIFLLGVANGAGNKKKSK